MGAADLDDFFLIVNACIIFFMQAGFAFLECGAVRSKNATNILMKNLLDAFVGLIVYWWVGYALAFGGDGDIFAGHRHFGLVDLSTTNYAFFFFHFVFAATAATIVSGAVAERCGFVAYFVYSIFTTGLVYPVVSHWTWSSEGFLSVGTPHSSSNSTVTFNDFGGSGTVHLTGGVISLVAAFMIGPRIGRFDEDGKPQDLLGHSVPFAGLGCFILLFGFFAFNGGSQGGIGDGDGPFVAVAVVNTIVAGSFGGLTTMATCRFTKLSGKWSFLFTINGGLCGMVSVCAGCNMMAPWGSALTGLVAGLIYIAVSILMLKAKIDDPLDAVAVHGGGGLWGLIAATLFNKETGVFLKADSLSGMLFLWNLMGGCIIIIWSLSWSFAIFILLRYTKLLRVPAHIEIGGMDEAKHGEAAYPRKSYEEGWAPDARSHNPLVAVAPDETVNI